MLAPYQLQFPTVKGASASTIAVTVLIQMVTHHGGVSTPKAQESLPAFGISGVGGTRNVHAIIINQSVAILLPFG